MANRLNDFIYLELDADSGYIPSFMPLPVLTIFSKQQIALSFDLEP